MLCQCDSMCQYGVLQLSIRIHAGCASVTGLFVPFYAHIYAHVTLLNYCNTVTRRAEVSVYQPQSVTAVLSHVLAQCHSWMFADEQRRTS